MPDLLTILGLAAFVLIFAGLSEGFVSRAPLSFPMIFLGLGFLLGSRGVISTEPDSRTLEAVATVTLALVLFLDAVRMKFDRSSREWLVPSLVLGPGTLLTLVLVAAGAHFLLGLGLASSILVGAILSSTDPVVVRDVVRDKRIPGAVRQSLTTEAATNDIVVLPIVLITIAVVQAEASSAGEWAMVLGQAPGARPRPRFRDRRGGRVAHVPDGPPLRHPAGVPVALRHGPRVRDVHRRPSPSGATGSSPSFAAGAAIAALDLRLCDCFLEYGDATSEMIMLFAFILFGAVLSTLVGTVPLAATLALAAVTLFVARPAAVAIVLRNAAVSGSARAFIAWFGPRGLASLLLALLVVQAKLPGARDDPRDRRRRRDRLGRPARRLGHAADAAGTPRACARETLAEERVSSAADLLRSGKVDGRRAADGRSPGPAALEGDRRAAPDSRRPVAFELREGPGRNSGGRARAAGRGRGLGRPAPARAADRRLLHLPERRHECPGRGEAAEHGLPGLGVEGRPRGLAQGGRRRGRAGAPGGRDPGGNGGIGVEPARKPGGHDPANEGKPPAMRERRAQRGGNAASTFRRPS